MMPEKFGIAVVGCGRISTSHLSGIKEMERKIALVATVDNIPDRAKLAAEKNGARRWYSSTAEAFRDPEIEGVILSLPHYLHYPITLEALAAGKHVMVEKPMANSYAEAREMAAEGESRGLTLMVGQSRRYFNAILESKRRIAEIGRLINSVTIWHTYLEKPATEWWKSAPRAGGLLIALNGSHAVDYVTWMMGKLPETVFTKTLHNNSLWEGEDEVTMVLDYGAETASIHLSFNTRQFIHTRLLVGTQGTMALKGEDELNVNGQVVVSGEQKPSNFALQAQEFADAVREKREPLSSGRVVAPTIAVLDAARLSARQGKPVRVRDIMEG
jgi:predicted dehydrogenase